MGPVVFGTGGNNFLVTILVFLIVLAVLAAAGLAWYAYRRGWFKRLGAGTTGLRLPRVPSAPANWKPRLMNLMRSTPGGEQSHAKEEEPIRGDPPSTGAKSVVPQPEAAGKVTSGRPSSDPDPAARRSQQGQHQQPPPPPSQPPVAEKPREEQWKLLEEKQPALATTLRSCCEMMEDPRRFPRECETVWGTLRTELMKCRRASEILEECRRGERAPDQAGLLTKALPLEDVPEKATVWFSLLQIAEQRPIFRNQVRELIDMLTPDPAWSQALRAADNGEVLRKMEAVVPSPRPS